MVMVSTECASTRPDVTDEDIVIIRQLCMPLKIIATEMDMNYSTIRTKVYRLQDKFGVENNRALIVKAIRLGMVSISDLAYREYRRDG